VGQIIVVCGLPGCAAAVFSEGAAGRRRKTIVCSTKSLRSPKRLSTLTDRFAGFEAQSPNVHVDYPLFQRMAQPVTLGNTKIAGIKIHDTRMIRLMELLLHGGTQLNG
jgi:hypothetical protein